MRCCGNCRSVIQPLAAVVGLWGRVDLGYGRLRRPNPRLCECSSALRLRRPAIIIKEQSAPRNCVAKEKRKALQYSHSLGFGLRQEAIPQDNCNKTKPNRGQRLNIRVAAVGIVAILFNRWPRLWVLEGRVDLGYGRLRRPNPRLCEYSSALRLRRMWLCTRYALRLWRPRLSTRGALRLWRHVVSSVLA